MKKLKCESPKVYAIYIDNTLFTGTEICLPDNANENIWKLFDNIELAKDYFGIKEEEIKL